MTRHYAVLKSAILITLLLITPITCADWLLDEEVSELTFTTIKKDSIAETHSFGELTGKVTADGQARLGILLTSLDTANPVRDERMGIHLFETDQFSTAYFDVTLKLDQVAQLSAGETLTVELDGILSLHGFEKPLKASVLVSRYAATGFLVESASPIIVHGEEFGFSGGLKKLSELAGMIPIEPEVKVYLKLGFKPE
jgi:polyisoprenoid-binding protein YceI